MTDLEKLMLENQAVLMSAVSTLVSINPEITPVIKGLIHRSLDESITETINTINKKDPPE